MGLRNRMEDSTMLSSWRVVMIMAKMRAPKVLMV
jgi:hypothetical protein